MLDDRFRKVFEEAPVGMATFTPDLQLLDTNAAFQRMLGSYVEFISDADRDEMSKSLKAAAGTSHIAKLTNTEMTLEEPSSAIACKRLPG